MPSALVLNLVMALASTSIHDMKPAPDVESFQLDYNQDLAACRLKLEAGICSYLGNLKVEQFEEHYAAALRAARERGDSGEVSCTTPDGSAAYPCVRRETEHLELIRK